MSCSKAMEDRDAQLDDDAPGAAECGGTERQLSWSRLLLLRESQPQLAVDYVGVLMALGRTDQLLPFLHAEREYDVEQVLSVSTSPPVFAVVNR